MYFINKQFANSFHIEYTLFLKRVVVQEKGAVGWCEGVGYFMSAGHSTDTGLQLGKACYPSSR